jgi:hypothetical protein
MEKEEKERKSVYVMRKAPEQKLSGISLDKRAAGDSRSVAK